MRDEHDDRVYQAFRHDLATNIAGLVDQIAYAFDRLHARLYGAPWSSQPGKNDASCTTRLTTL